MKQCTHKDCLKWYPETDEYFYSEKKKSKKKGVYYKLSNWCKECKRNYQNKYVVDNIERVTEYKKEYNRRENTIAIKTDHNRMYYKKHTEKFQIKMKKWNQDPLNKENMKNRKQKIHNISKLEWKNCKEYFDNSCAYCGLHHNEHYRMYGGKLQKIDLHKEHVDDKGSDYISNCVPSCQSCNSSKASYRFEEWYTQDNQNYDQLRYEKIIMWLQGDYQHSDKT